jgi:hypothetical protein
VRTGEYKLQVSQVEEDMDEQVSAVEEVEVATVIQEEVPPESLGDQIIRILKSLHGYDTDLVQRIEKEVFPLLIDAETALRADAFRLIKRRFDLMAKELRSLEDHFARFEIIAKLNEASQRQKAVMTDERMEKALMRLQSPDFFDLLLQDLETLGLVDEQKNAIILFLIFQSARMTQPLHLVIQGVSSGGKTSTLKTVLMLLPEDGKLMVASASSRAFEYLPETMTRNKVVLIEEFEGLEATIATLRVILSEGNATRAVVQQNPFTKTFETIIHTTCHKFVMVTTTTKEFIDHEMANRLFRLEIDQTKTHLRNVSVMIRKRHVDKSKKREGERLEIQRLHQAMHKLLRELEVEIPFAAYIEFPHSQARHNRDLEKFLRLIEVIAFVRQYQRKVVERNGCKCIQAEIDDYRLAYTLLSSCLGEAFEKLPEAEAAVLRMIIKYVTEVLNEDSQATRGFIPITTRLIKEEAAKGEIDVGDQTKIGHILKSLEYQGLLTSTDPPQQGSRRKYNLPDDVDMNKEGDFIGLPSVTLDQVSTPEELVYRVEHGIPAGEDLPENLGGCQDSICIVRDSTPKNQQTEE